MQLSPAEKQSAAQAKRLETIYRHLNTSLQDLGDLRTECRSDDAHGEIIEAQEALIKAMNKVVRAINFAREYTSDREYAESPYED